MTPQLRRSQHGCQKFWNRCRVTPKISQSCKMWGWISSFRQRQATVRLKDLHTYGTMTDHKQSRSRSKAACQFCRARKLKCDNLEPTCSACKARNIHCEYVIRAPAPRPSNAAIHALQNEVARLRRLLTQADVKVTDEIDVDAGAEDGSPRPSTSSHAQTLTSPVFSDGMRRPSDAEHMFDPQLQSMHTHSGMSQTYNQQFAVRHVPSQRRIPEP